jgi:hypothetical protein
MLLLKQLGKYLVQTTANTFLFKILWNFCHLLVLYLTIDRLIRLRKLVRFSSQKVIKSTIYLYENNEFQGETELNE